MNVVDPTLGRTQLNLKLNAKILCEICVCWEGEEKEMTTPEHDEVRRKWNRMRRMDGRGGGRKGKSLLLRGSPVTTHTCAHKHGHTAQTHSLRQTHFNPLYCLRNHRTSVLTSMFSCSCSQYGNYKKNYTSPKV